jgi:hypothetical protein
MSGRPSGSARCDGWRVRRLAWPTWAAAGWCVLSLATVSAGPRAPQRIEKPARIKKSPPRDCELWPPRGFPKVQDLYALKLEYDCRVRAIARQRMDLAVRETRRSTELAEKQDLAGLDQKNAWVAQEQGELETRQRELDRWRDEVIMRLQLARPLDDADRAVSATTEEK